MIRLACPLCGASNYAVQNRRTRKDNVDVWNVKCKCCTTAWQTYVFGGRVLSDDEADEVGIAVDAPVSVAIPDIGKIRVAWATLLTLPVNPAARGAIEELGHALQRPGLLPDEMDDEEDEEEIHAHL